MRRVRRALGVVVAGALLGGCTLVPTDVAPRTVTIPIINDALVTGNLNFSFSLSGIGGGAVLGTSNAVVTIIEVNGVVQFSSSTYVVAENVTNALITVTRSGARSFSATRRSRDFCRA